MKEIIKYKANDGELFDTTYECLKHEFKGKYGSAFDCPVCKCTGEIDMKDFPITEKKFFPEDQGWQGNFSPIVYRDVVVGYKKGTCAKCIGRGFTTKELKPVTKTVITGYE